MFVVGERCAVTEQTEVKSLFLPRTVLNNVARVRSTFTMKYDYHWTDNINPQNTHIYNYCEHEQQYYHNLKVAVDFYRN